MTGSNVSHIHVLMDTSGSMESMQETAYTGVAELATVATDTVTISHFSHDLTIGEPQAVADFSAACIRRQASGTTALYDSIVACVNHELARSVTGLRTIVVVTDGMDTSSSIATAADATKVLQDAKRAGIDVKYVGANQSLEYATQLGIREQDALVYDATDQGMFRGLAAVRRAVSCRSADGSSAPFTVAERAESMPNLEGSPRIVRQRSCMR